MGVPGSAAVLKVLAVQLSECFHGGVLGDKLSPLAAWLFLFLNLRAVFLSALTPESAACSASTAGLLPIVGSCWQSLRAQPRVAKAWAVPKQCTATFLLKQCLC